MKRKDCLRKSSRRKRRPLTRAKSRWKRPKRRPRSPLSAPSESVKKRKPRPRSMQLRVVDMVGVDPGVLKVQVEKVVVGLEERVAVVAAVGVVEEEAVAKAAVEVVAAAVEKVKDAAWKTPLGEEMLIEALHGMTASMSPLSMSLMKI